ncbi:peptide synthetase [Streptomyces sp. Ru73]|uniref:Pls/PosA family non-ribosomal peptide synthetase n=1 Tax=Streptomyces sp. Ru73 TaxID=2080748 RepID=UPI000CDDAEE0|nr:Pls/PosA family non-ribosomal peptide synthetase [Streptomyces sp. Ru73]POX38709.1 peptide synthetase [Streptomyces sp. Ru73]
MVGKNVQVSTTDLAEPSTVPLDPALPAAPGSTEDLFAEVLAAVVRVDHVPPDSHFFDDLNADSMLMARFCARVRKRDDLPSVSMKDIYRYPTIRSLAAAFDTPAPATAAANGSAHGNGSAAAPAPARPVPVPGAPAPLEPARTRTAEYVLCGTLQLLLFLGYAYVTALVLAIGYDWIAAGSGLLDGYVRAVLFGGAVFLGVCLLPIAAKWLLIGRWKPRKIRIWSLAYVRFWLVRTLIQLNPLVLFAGSPLYVLYLKALGARIGRRVAVLTKHVPVCTDLLTVGDDSVIRKEAHLSCYRAESGWIRTGTVTLGKDVYVSEATVLDIDVSMGDGAQLGHASSLHAGQSVPAGERWHGTPARPADTDYRTVGPAPYRPVSRVLYSLTQLLTALLVYVPLVIGGVDLLVAQVPQLDSLLSSQPLTFTSWTFYRDALAASFVLFFGSLVFGFLFITTVPRLLHRFLRPDRVYPLYGFHYSVHRAIARLTNNKVFMRLAGDSSLVVHYLRSIGYDLTGVEQTGSNFGTDVKHENPYLTTVGTGTMVADGLSVMNADYSSTSFRVTRVTIGPHNFLGNQVSYPSGGRTGGNCLLATKVMVPIDGKVREGVGLLGSPSFEIPRSVERDASFDHLSSGDELRRRLAAKNRHNAVTLASFLFARWIHAFGVLLLMGAAAGLYASLGALAVAAATVLTVAFTIGFTALAERASIRFRPQSPRFCSIYHPHFWQHERFWKHQAMELRLLNGTPFKGMFWRLLGVRLGRRLFDDGARMPERTLVTIGDDCTLNVSSVIQCHSQEDGSFKSDRTSLGNGCTLGVGTLVHYGVTVGDGVVLGPDSFLMKGEEVPAHSRWGGNPAHEM